MTWKVNLLRKCFDLKATEQIRTQSTKSSSIILALTDGKLEVYVHELTMNEVSWNQSVFIDVIIIIFQHN